LTIERSAVVRTVRKFKQVKRFLKLLLFTVDFVQFIIMILSNDFGLDNIIEETVGVLLNSSVFIDHRHR
jgi:hypothetical protein